MNMLFGNIQPLGIMAPPAGQRASFKKNSCPDTGPIVDGILFYVENDSAGHGRYSKVSGFSFRISARTQAVETIWWIEKKFVHES